MFGIRGFRSGQRKSDVGARALISLALLCAAASTQAGEIAGGVTRGDNGQPITDGAVRIYNSSGNYLGLALIDNAGRYTYSGLAAGNYFAVTYGTGFFDELWDHKPCAQGACTVTTGTRIAVGAGTTTANFSLATGGSITGIVTASATGQPVTDGAVRIYDSGGRYLGLSLIDNAGRYIYGGLAAGNYFAVTYDTGFSDELWDNKPCAQGTCTVSNGTPIVVTATGATTANFALASGGSINGIVTASATGQPIADGVVRIYDGGGSYLGLALINNAGRYSYGGLAVGNYFAVTYGTGFSDELWDNLPCPEGSCSVTSGTTIHVANSSVTANFALGSGGAISGTVTQSAGGQPIADGAVRIYDNSGNYLGLALIDNAGRYTHSGLAAGNYFAVTYGTGFFDELWDNKPCAQGACTVTTGTRIAVGAGTTTANFSLATGGSIAGIVTASVTGQPVTDGAVRIYDSGGSYLGLALIDNAGRYTYGGLAAGHYFAVTYGTRFIDELWDDKPCAQGACTITAGTPIIVAGTGTTSANFQLSGSADLIFRSGFETPSPTQLGAFETDGLSVGTFACRKSVNPAQRRAEEPSCANRNW